MSDPWHFAINADEVEKEDVMPSEVQGVKLAIYQINGEYFATSRMCTHGDADLTEGIVIDDVIECPLHQGRFCITTGRALSPPVSSPITAYPTRVDNGKVYIQLTSFKITEC